MREMPYGQWLAFNADDSVHKCDGASGYDAWPSVPHGLQPPTPPYVPKPTPAAPQPQKTYTPPLQKKGMPGWLETLLGWLFVLFLVYLFSLFHKK